MAWACQAGRGPAPSVSGIRRHLNRFASWLWLCCPSTTNRTNRTTNDGWVTEPGAAGFAALQDDHPLSALILKAVEHGVSNAHSANHRHPPANAHPPSPRSSRARGSDRHGRPHPRRPAAIRLGRSRTAHGTRHQSPARDPTRKAFHSSLENARIGPKGSFESRTSTAAPVMATSTQLPVPLAVLFFHRRGPCW